MAVTEVTHENWFSRIVESIQGILVGLVIFVIAFPLLFWNEGRAVKTARSLSEGAAAVVSVPSDKVDGTFDGKEIHIQGLATTSETLSDSTFGVTLPAIKLKRDVEMYQWKQKSSTKTQKKVGGGTKKVTTYSYEKVWSDKAIASGDFKEAGHDNPGALPYQSKSQVANLVTVGAFKLSPGLIAKINKWEPQPVDQNTLGLTSPDVRSKLQVSSGDYYIGADPTAPKIGDVKIDFQVVKPTEVSVVAQQQGSQLKPYATQQSGYDIELLELGDVSAKDMFKAAQSRNSTLTWILRGVGFVMLFMGLFMVGRPFAVVADFIPVIGAFFRVGVGLFAGLLAFGFWLITVAVAWIFYRPILGVLLLSAGALFLLGFVAIAIVFGRRRKSAPQPAPAPEPESGAG